MSIGRRIYLSQFLTDEEIKLAREIYRNDLSNFHKRVLKEIINPNMERIDKALGHDNDAEYLATAMEFAIGMLGP